MENNRYTYPVEYIYNVNNEQVLLNIQKIFKCLDEKTNLVYLIHPKFKKYNEINDYYNMFEILVKLKNTTFVNNYESCKFVIINEKINYISFDGILEYLSANKSNSFKAQILKKRKF